MLTAASFLLTRWTRFLFFLLCSPILLPFICLSIPLLCAVEIFSRLRCRILNSTPSSAVSVDEDDLRLRRCEEGCGGCGELVVEEENDGIEGSGLLQRYLEDQLILARSIYNCGEDDGDHNHVPIRVPLLS